MKKLLHFTNVKTLRVGNHVLHNDKEIEVHGIMRDSIAYFEGISFSEPAMTCVHASKLSPIGITEEILKRCGFNKSNNQPEEGLYTVTRYEHNFDDDPLSFAIVEITTTGLIGIKFIGPAVTVKDLNIHFLHELENAYFMAFDTEIKFSKK